MRKLLTFSMLCLLFLSFTPQLRAQDTDIENTEVPAVTGVTAVIDIDGRSISIQVNDLDGCQRAITNRINNLKFLFQDGLTTANVVGQCFDRNGNLLAAGRCGVKMVGQLTRLCVPQLQ